MASDERFQAEVKARQNAERARILDERALGECRELLESETAWADDYHSQLVQARAVFAALQVAVREAVRRQREDVACGDWCGVLTVLGPIVDGWDKARLEKKSGAS